MDRLQHPAILHISQGGGMCPEQWVGQLTDGRWFYLRMRWGHAKLGIGWCEDDAVADTMAGQGVQQDVCYARDPLRGFFEDDGELNATFATLLQRRAPELVTS